MLRNFYTQRKVIFSTGMITFDAQIMNFELTGLDLQRALIDLQAVDTQNGRSIEITKDST